MSNTHERDARFRKSSHMADALLAQNVTADFVGAMPVDSAWWNLVADAATVMSGEKVHRPHSQETVVEVLALMRRRQSYRFDSVAGGSR